MIAAQYPWRVRLAWACRGYMYFVDACESECLDIARGLWLTGADYVSLYVSGAPHQQHWTYSGNRHNTSRDGQTGGYSSS